MQIASCLTHNRVSGHGLTQRIEEHHQFVDIHVSIDGSLTVHGHDGYTDEQVEGGRLIVCPAGLPDSQSIFFGEFPLETDKQPSVAEHECEALLCAVQVGIEGRDEKLNQQTKWLLEKIFENGKGSSHNTTRDRCTVSDNQSYRNL